MKKVLCDFVLKLCFQKIFKSIYTSQHFFHYSFQYFQYRNISPPFSIKLKTKNGKAETPNRNYFPNDNNHSGENPRSQKVTTAAHLPAQSASEPSTMTGRKVKWPIFLPILPAVKVTGKARWQKSLSLSLPGKNLAPGLHSTHALHLHAILWSYRGRTRGCCSPVQTISTQNSANPSSQVRKVNFPHPL